MWMTVVKTRGARGACTALHLLAGRKASARAGHHRRCIGNAGSPDTTLIPPRTQYGEIRSKRGKNRRLRYAGIAIKCNNQQPAASDYESEGRRFESCRARPL